MKLGQVRFEQPEAMPPPAPAGIVWTPEQEAIFRAFADPDSGSLMIDAKAGAAKTTVLVEGLRHLPPGTRAVFLAFNRDIVETLRERVGRRATVSTFHSLGFAALKRRYGAWQRQDWVRTDKALALTDLWQADGTLTRDEVRAFAAPARKLAALAKQWGIGPVEPDEQEVWERLIDHFEVEMPSNAVPGQVYSRLFYEANRAALGWRARRDVYDEDDAQQAREQHALDTEQGPRVTRLAVIDLARALLQASVDTAEDAIDFDDMVYLPLRFGLSLQQYDVVCVDEAQDTNAVQRALLHRLVAPGGRLIAVGDRHQAIYGFRGADADAFEAIRAEFGCAVLTLNVSFRCAWAVIAKAREIVSDIRPRADAPTGDVREVGTYDDTLLRELDVEDAVICRNNAPLARLAFTLWRLQVPFRFRDRERGAGVLKLIDRIGETYLPRFMAALDQYVEQEVGRLEARGRGQEAAALEDRAEVIRAVREHLPDECTRVRELRAEVQRLYTPPPGPAVTLSTIHSVKGAEYGRVWFLDDWLLPSRYARQAWQQQQERNLRYVAVTRAKHTLLYMKSPKPERRG